MPNKKSIYISTLMLLYASSCFKILNFRGHFIITMSYYFPWFIILIYTIKPPFSVWENITVRKSAALSLDATLFTTCTSSQHVSSLLYSNSSTAMNRPNGLWSRRLFIIDIIIIIYLSLSFIISTLISIAIYYLISYNYFHRHHPGITSSSFIIFIYWFICTIIHYLFIP